MRPFRLVTGHLGRGLLRLAAVTAAVLSLLATMLVVTSSPASADYGVDGFYKQPRHRVLRHFKRGQVIRSRPVTVKLAGALPVPVRAWQVMYRSTNEHRRPVADVTTVIVPTTPWLGGGPRPVVSDQFAEDSTALRCAPSVSLQNGSNAIVSAQSGSTVAFLQQGWAVLAPDHEGPRSEFVGSYQEGRAVLDGIKAGLGFGPAGLSPAAKVALAGYSGGAHATAWASELQPRYAPGLAANLVGAAEGGTPVDLKATAHHIDGTSNAGLALMPLATVRRAYPRVHVRRYLNRAGKAMLRDIGNKCGQEAIMQYGGRHFDDYTKRPDMIDKRRFAKLFRQNLLGRRTPRIPIFDYHATNDEIVPSAPDDVMVAKYCARGVAVDKVRNPAADHVSMEPSTFPQVLSWLRDRFAGKPAPRTC